MAKRHGVSPLKWASSIGLLTPRTTLGHAIFIDDHPSIEWRACEDLALLADTGTTVAHCPSPFARYGHAMADFGRYSRGFGVNLGFGTDVTPHNLIEEMRLAIILARVMANNIGTTDAQWYFTQRRSAEPVRCCGMTSVGSRRARKRIWCLSTRLIRSCGPGPPIR
ncbi:MAG: hypothetical protein Ct9H300mP16_09780 [Pseudomonadota bacterium]|nr:MAG: hypothetical protein Ct9H300mP16_09780 [Pseudomonadota bacterium]